MKRLFTGVIATVLAVSTLPAMAKEKIVFAIGGTAQSLQGRTAAEFTKRANKALGSKAEVQLFDSGSLGKDKELMQKLKLGSVHISLPSSVMSDISGQFALFDLPFLVADRAHVGRIEDAIFWSKIAPTVESKGYKVLAVWENGVRHITNNARPINNPEDLKGLKVRVPQSKWRVMMFEAWGARPTPMAFSEVFVGLQTGVIDGQENPHTNAYGAKFNEVQKYLSITGHVYSPAYPTMGKAVYDKMNPEIRGILEKTAREVALWARAEGAKEDKDLEALLVSKGMKLNTANREKFVAVSKSVYTAFSADVPGGQELIDAALKLSK